MRYQIDLKSTEKSEKTRKKRLKLIENDVIMLKRLLCSLEKAMITNSSNGLKDLSVVFRQKSKKQLKSAVIESEDVSFEGDELVIKTSTDAPAIKIEEKSYDAREEYRLNNKTGEITVLIKPQFLTKDAHSSEKVFKFALNRENKSVLPSLQDLLGSDCEQCLKRVSRKLRTIALLCGFYNDAMLAIEEQKKIIADGYVFLIKENGVDGGYDISIDREVQQELIHITPNGECLYTPLDKNNPIELDGKDGILSKLLHLTI